MNKLNKNIEARLPPTLTIHALTHDGRGIGTLDQKATFVAGALPGETVQCQITQKKGSYNEAKLVHIETPAPERVTPPCPHFGVCGGCSLQHMHINMQAQLKEQTLLDQLTHFGKVTPAHRLPALQSDSLGYRRKARLGAKFVIKKDKLLVGFREKSSRYLADLEGCPVLYPAIGEHFGELAALIRLLDQYTTVPQVEIAVGDTEVALVFRHLEPLSANDQAKLIAFGETHHFAIYCQPNPPAKVHRIHPSTGDDRLHYTLPEFKLEFAFHPLDFTQVNLGMNRLMVSQAVNLLDLQPTDHVLDLFCGIGNFTLPMATRAKHVTGVEGSAEMVERGYENSRRNGIANVEFHAANLMADTQTAAWASARYDKILLDPPRAGAQEILPLIGNMQVKRIVYVSCNPATLARDAGLLVHQHGFCLKSVGIMNMFPHTSHIEAMAVFERN